MTRLKDKIPVEPLDEVRLARIERSIVSEIGRMDDSPRVEARPRRSWLLPAVSAAVAAAAVFLFLRQSGYVSPEHPTARFEVVTDESASSVEIERARLDVAAHSSVLVEQRPGQSVVIELADGRIDFDVEKRPDRPEFVVVAADVEVRVVGTAFSVERRGPRVRVEVTRGTVRVNSVSGARTLNAGASWSTKEWLAANQASAKQDQRQPDTSSADTAGSDETELDGQQAIDTRARDSKAQLRPRAGARTGQEQDSSRPATRRGDHTRKADGGNATTRKVDGGNATTQGDFAPFRAPRGLDAIMKVSMSSPKEVEDHYRALSLRTGNAEQASFALYSLMYWQLYRLRNPQAAVQSADRYRRRFRRGPHAQSALWVRVSALCAAGQNQRCRAAAHSYMSKYPGGRFARLAKRVVDGQ